MYEDLIKKCREVVKCDTARISKPLDRMFFIIGFNRNAKDDPWQYIKNGEPYDFKYVQENVIASGNSDIELLENVKEYQRLCGITWEQYFSELASSTQKEQPIVENVTESLQFVRFTSNNEIRFCQDHGFWKGLPDDIQFYPVEETPNGLMVFVGDGYGLLPKYGVAGKYGNGAVYVFINDIPDIIDWCRANFI